MNKKNLSPEVARISAIVDEHGVAGSVRSGLLAKAAWDAVPGGRSARRPAVSTLEGVIDKLKQAEAES